MEFDLSAVLLGLTVVFGVIWALDRMVFAKRRAAGRAEPMIVDWARSLFPVVLLVLVLRSFVAEPFRIPSGSMMPTLDIGDFILVNKFAYGLRLPVFNDKVVSLGEPKRGDVVVFRWPGFRCEAADGSTIRGGDINCNSPVPSQNWIKRVIGLPGDHIEVNGDELRINGTPVTAQEVGPFVGNTSHDTDRMMMQRQATVWNEDLMGVRHLIARMPPSPNYDPPPSIPGQLVTSGTVPANCYLVMGDNRYDSLDSRWWGCVPEKNLAGKAFLIWLSWTGHGIAFHRIGTLIH
ncbi:signal peptidase I [Frateuria aurantia]|uniref:Signal peptidase I n=1 Tax=Frateuria aurantia (strain ATCC 33424 / DSM 6220 / KCTC 2777 / LMG 1558 / NBRC 3245 / NCIMB 13370) TaxID=767434 RepID=H8L390_FRAAD|nr:signal peptidase I [Frateuria aurantia]AFC85526.1 signal peptidase I [Frateuria aurantia DSM 6220]